jgi:hypothetical protein
MHVADLPAEQPELDAVGLAGRGRARMRSELDARPPAHLFHHTQGELFAVVR